MKHYYVPKPWGKEYICWESENTAVWYLEIEPGKETSFHCHPNKSTGLILLDGSISVELINSKYQLEPLNKINIFKGRFHKSKSTSNFKSTLLEIENPVKKDDLVRLTDSNGRENSRYENEKIYFDNLNYLHFGRVNNYKKNTKFNGVQFTIYNFFELKEINHICNGLKGENFMLLEGYILEKENSHKIVNAGEIIDGEVFLRFMKRFIPSRNILILKISKIDF